MTSINLTRAEAEARSTLLSVDHYEITLDLNQGESDFGSTTVVSFQVKEAGDTFIDLRAKRIDGVRLDGRDIRQSAVPLDSQGYDDTHGIALQGLTPGRHTLEVVATCPYSRTGEGLHRFVDPADNEVYLYSQFETADAKRVFACFDQPDLKATYGLKVHTPRDWKVISNAPQQTHFSEEHATHTSRVDTPISTYLVAVCAGRYTEVHDTWRGKLTHHAETPVDQPHELEVPLGLYVRRSLAKHLDAQRLFTETKQGFDFFHANFGMAYPFGKYDQVFCPEYNMGAMENAGCVTIRDEYVFSSKATHYKYERRAETILHELAHMWFGDLVTMEWWDDLWLNESFATWSAAISQAEATEYDTAWVTFANVEKSWAYQQDQLPSTHPISADAHDIETVEQNFDGITYAKGASVLKQLQAYVGREEFLAGVRRHFATHAWGNATFDDLLGALESTSGRDLGDWADQWLRSTGINRLSPDFEVEGGKYTRFSITQSGAEPGAGELRTHRIAVGLYSLIDGRVSRTKRVELDIEGASTAVPELVGIEAADLVLVNDDDLTYCLMELDNESRNFVVENIARVEDPMARTLCWSAAWEATRGGHMKARDFISLVARGAHAETEHAVLERILNQAAQAWKSYADPDWAEGNGREILNQALLEGARGEDSERALIFTQALAKMTLTEDSLGFFREILADGNSNLTVDADLRWWALTALIAHDEIEDPAKAIATERSRDRSASGEQAALRAEAAINTPENKAKIFAELVNLDHELSNLAVRHKLEGLNFTGSAPHLEQFNESVFELAPAIWEKWSSELALTTLSGIYPSWDITPRSLDSAERFLSGQHPAGLLRLMAEERARVERALNNRVVDAA
ncbi:Aminopeptidase N [Corynebacterium occultum]|uniref:Aminopeptidase N n=1 Tax=Corynebacterium occultum TaxID=2675219 RepID=A0A6B8W9Z0_9CORY|nr:aminopeptidase N [Corynebacterium occultum]QGU08085.1 Aminopeptidase N [Corynebacterium occultum]